MTGVAGAAEAAAAGWVETVIEYSAGHLDAETLSLRQAMHAGQLHSFKEALNDATPPNSTAWAEMGIPERRRALLHRLQAIEIAPARHSGRFDPARINATPRT